jgi:hypothetical protein
VQLRKIKCLLGDWERGLGTVLFHWPSNERSGGNRHFSHIHYSSYTRRNGGNGEANTRPLASSPVHLLLVPLTRLFPLTPLPIFARMNNARLAQMLRQPKGT